MDQRDAQKAAQNLHEVSSENIVQAYDDYRSHEDHVSYLYNSFHGIRKRRIESLTINNQIQINTDNAF